MHAARDASSSTASLALLHIKDKAKSGCALHLALHEAFHSKVRRCIAVGCNEAFSTTADLLSHLEFATDASHVACKSQAAEIVSLHQPIDASMNRATAEIAAGPRGTLLKFTQRPSRDVDSVEDIGTRLWDSSVVLARLLQYLDAMPGYNGALSTRRLAGKRACELGAGCGLAGLCLALHGVASVTFTDLDEVMPHLEANVVANAAIIADAVVTSTSRIHCINTPTTTTITTHTSTVPAHQQSSSSPASNHEDRLLPILSCVPFTWGTQPHGAGLPAAMDADAFDVVIGTDLIYLSSQIDPLLETLNDLAGPGTLIVLAFERRSAEVWRRLEDALRAAQVHTVPVPEATLEAAMRYAGAKPWANHEAESRVDRLAVILCRMPGATEESVPLDEEGKRMCWHEVE